MIHELVLHTSKSHQNIVGTQANYESTKYSNEKSKSNKVLRTTAKMMHELLPDRKKVMETLRARRMIRLLPERYDLNRPLVSSSAILTGQARNGVSKSKATTQLVTVSRTFMILASLLWDPWRIHTNLVPRSYKLQIEVLKSTGVFKENLNNSTRTHVTHLKAEGKKYTHQQLSRGASNLGMFFLLSLSVSAHPNSYRGLGIAKNCVLLDCADLRAVFRYVSSGACLNHWSLVSS